MRLHGLCDSLHVLFELDDELGDDRWDVVPLMRWVSDLLVDEGVLDALTLKPKHKIVIVDPFAWVLRFSFLFNHFQRSNLLPLFKILTLFS